MNRRVLGAWPIALALAGVSTATVSSITTTGTIVAEDVCANLVVTIAPDGSNRHQLASLGDLNRLADVSVGVTPRFALIIGRADPADSTSPSALYAVDLSGSAASVRLDAPVPAADAALFPGATRVAWVRDYADPPTTNHDDLWLADVVFDASGHPAALANATFLVDLRTLGSPADTVASGPAFGMPVVDPDGSRLAVTIWDDLWVLELGSDGRSVAHASNITRTRDRAEWYPAWAPSGSPAGDAIAYSGGPYSHFGSLIGMALRDIDVFVTPSTGGIQRQVTTKQNRGPAGDERAHPAWSPDGRWLVFHAQGRSARGKRSSPCEGLVNYDLFQIPWDGSSKAANITNTAGTSVELRPAWAP